MDEERAGEQANKQACMRHFSDWLRMDPVRMSWRRCPVGCSTPEKTLLGGPSWSECSRAGEALLRMVRRDWRWELEEGYKEAACGASIQDVQGMG